MRHFVLLLALALACSSTAQPTWRFHLAFEDGTGAKDTIWLVYDTAVTIPYSHWPLPTAEYDSVQNAENYGNGSFHVCLQNSLHDTTNSLAFPYWAYPMFETGNHIDAINWVPPMTIRWDTSLFHAPYLPYSQGHFGIALMDGIAFSQFDTGLGFGQYNMLTNDSVTIDFLSDFLFPFPVYFGPVDDTGISNPSFAWGPLRLWPNPVQSILHLQSAKPWDELQIQDLSGRVVKKFLKPSRTETMDVSSLPPGIYIVIAISTQNHLYHGKFQKVD